MINMHAFVQMSPARDTLWTDWSRSRRGRSESSNYDYPYDIYVSSDKSHWQLVSSFYLSALFLSRDTQQRYYTPQSTFGMSVTYPAVFDEASDCRFEPRPWWWQKKKKTSHTHVYKFQRKKNRRENEEVEGEEETKRERVAAAHGSNICTSPWTDRRGVSTQASSTYWLNY